MNFKELNEVFEEEEEVVIVKYDDIVEVMIEIVIVLCELLCEKLKLLLA